MALVAGGGLHDEERGVHVAPQPFHLRLVPAESVCEAGAQAGLVIHEARGDGVELRPAEVIVQRDRAVVVADAAVAGLRVQRILRDLDVQVSRILVDVVDVQREPRCQLLADAERRLDVVRRLHVHLHQVHGRRGGAAARDHHLPQRFRVGGARVLEFVRAPACRLPLVEGHEGRDAIVHDSESTAQIRSRVAEDVPRERRARRDVVQVVLPIALVEESLERGRRRERGVAHPRHREVVVESVDLRIVAQAERELEVRRDLPLVLRIRAHYPAVRHRACIVGRIRIVESDAYAAEQWLRAGVRSELEVAIAVAGEPAVRAHARELDTARDDVLPVAERVRGVIEKADVRLLQLEREAADAEGDSGIDELRAVHQRRLVVVPVQKVERQLVGERCTRLVRVAELNAVHLILGADAAVVRHSAAEEGFAVVEAPGPRRIDRVLVAERRGEAEHTVLVLRGCAERPGVLRPDAGRVRGLARDHRDGVVGVLVFVAPGEEELVLHDRSAEVEAGLHALVVGAAERGWTSRLRLALEHVQRIEVVVLAVEESRSVKLVRAAVCDGRDDERRAASVLRIVRVEVHAELAHRVLRDGRAGLRNPDEVAVEHALPLRSIEVEVPEAEIGKRARRRERASGSGRERLHARHDGREVHRVTRVERKVLDLRLHDRRGYVVALDLEGGLRLLAHHFHPLQCHRRLLQREVERRALTHEQRDVTLLLLVTDHAHGDVVAAGLESHHRVGPCAGYLRAVLLSGFVVQHTHLRACHWLAGGRENAALQHRGVLRVHAARREQQECGAEEQHARPTQYPVIRPYPD